MAHTRPATNPAPARCSPSIEVHGAEIDTTDTRQQGRKKVSHLTLDSMVQFAGLFDTRGAVLEIDKAALDAVGRALADVEGKPFRDSVRRHASSGKDSAGNVDFMACKGRDIAKKKKKKKAQAVEIARDHIGLQGLLEHMRDLNKIETRLFAGAGHGLRAPPALIIGLAERRLDTGADLTPAARTVSAQAGGGPIDEALPEVKPHGSIDLRDRVPVTGRAVPARPRRSRSDAEGRPLDVLCPPLRARDDSVSGNFVGGIERKRAEEAPMAADRRKDGFRATSAHGWRDPLAPVRHAARIRTAAVAGAAQAKCAQEVIDRQVDHVSRLLDDLLESPVPTP